MTAKEYLERDNKVWEKIDDANLTKATMIEFAQNYYESEVKNSALKRYRKALDYVSETTMDEYFEISTGTEKGNDVLEKALRIASGLSVD
jgi:regulator of sigma D